MKCLTGFMRKGRMRRRQSKTRKFKEINGWGDIVATVAFELFLEGVAMMLDFEKQSQEIERVY